MMTPKKTTIRYIDFFTFFPLEIICLIFNFLPPEAVAESTMVSKLWAQQLFRCDSCWSDVIVTELSGGDFLYPCQQLSHIIHHVHHLTLPYGSHYLQLFLNRMARTHSDTHFKSITFASHYIPPKSQTYNTKTLIKPPTPQFLVNFLSILIRKNHATLKSIILPNTARISPQIIKTRLARIGSKITINSIHFIKQEPTPIHPKPIYYPLPPLPKQLPHLRDPTQLLNWHTYWTEEDQDALVWLYRRLPDQWNTICLYLLRSSGGCRQKYRQIHEMYKSDKGGTRVPRPLSSWWEIS
ncbi:hypothetical protein INT45_000054 [Circinella minor]|uniref:Myb-like domain-containing protein n=1 Tax=Circinella minor TaxID=1195481 RepID=A0A8H7VJY4_9FUNG|nr:hypothetical protein INT45_000054 [Circinella minor]